jgi:hypothetical protein
LFQRGALSFIFVGLDVVFSSDTGL